MKISSNIKSDKAPIFVEKEIIETLQEEVIQEKVPIVKKETIIIKKEEKIPIVKKETILIKKEEKVIEIEKEVIQEKIPIFKKETIIIKKEDKSEEKEVIQEKVPIVKNETIIIKKEEETIEKALITKKESIIIKKEVVDKQKSPIAKNETIVIKKETTVIKKEETKEKAVIIKKEPLVGKKEEAREKIPEIIKKKSTINNKKVTPPITTITTNTKLKIEPVVETLITNEDEEIKNYILSLENKNDGLNEDIKSNREYDKDDLKKLEDSINDNENNNYDVNFDEIFTIETAKEKEEEKQNMYYHLKHGQPNHPIAKKAETLKKVYTTGSTELKKTFSPIKNNVIHMKKDETKQIRKVHDMKTINEEKINRLEEETKSHKLKSPSKTKMNFFNLKGSDGFHKEESISTYSKFNRTGYLYKKENKLLLNKPNYKIKGNLNDATKLLTEENKMKKTFIVLRNNTARSAYPNKSKNKIFSNSDYSNTQTRLFSTGKINKKYEDQKKNFLQLMNDPKNPYSTHWSTKILEKQYNVGIAISGYCNGVPLIKLVKKKDNSLPLIKKKLNEIMDWNKKEDMEFNTNKKNFFKARKDIAEEPIENEIRESTDNSGEIEYPFIFNYLK